MFLSIYSVCIIIYLIKRFCFIFKSVVEIEFRIKNYLEKLFFYRVNLRNDLYQHIKELILDNNYIELKKCLDFIVVLFNKMSIDDNCNEMDGLFDELADCIQECFISNNLNINILGVEKVLETMKIQKTIIKCKTNIEKDLFEKLIEVLYKDKEQFITIVGGVYNLLYKLPKKSLEIKIEKLNNGNRNLLIYIYSYYISKYIKDTKLVEDETVDALSEVFEDYVGELFGYDTNELVKRVSFEVICSLLLALYDKNWSKCYELLFINKYICFNIYYEKPEKCMVVLVQMSYLYMNRFYNKLDNEHIVNDSFKKVYIKHNIKISQVLYNIVEKAKTLFTDDYARKIYDLLVSRIRYFNNSFNVNDIKEFLIMLLYIVETDDDVITNICNNLMSGDYFVMYHHIFDDEDKVKQKLEYICSILSDKVIFKVRDKDLYGKFRRKIDALYSKHRLEQKKEYYDDCSVRISNFENNFNILVKQYVKDLIRPFNAIDEQKESMANEENQILVDLPVEIINDAQYIFGIVKEYIKNKIVYILQECIKNNIVIKHEKISDNSIKNYINTITNSEFLVGNEDFQYWELDRIQAKIANRINNKNSIILWSDDDAKYLIKINLNKLKLIFDDVVVSVRDYTYEEMLANCMINNDEYIVEIDTGIRVLLSKEKMIEYFKYSKKIVEVKYIYKYQIIDTNDIAVKTIFTIDK